MKKLALLAGALCAFLLATPVYAQLTGAPILNSIGNNLADVGGYSVVTGTNTVLVRDAESGRTLFVMKEVNQQTITLSSVVASLRTLTPEQKDRLLRHIAMFNISSAVGTLWLDQSTGQVTMQHHLNPRLVSQAGLVNTAVRFGDAVRAEQVRLLQ